MKVQKIVIIIVSVFAASLARAQYWYGPSGGPPPGSGWAPWPPGAGPYFRMGVGPTFFQDGNLKGYSFAPSPPFAGYTGPSGKVTYDVGVSGAFAFGWAFNRYVGLDFETGYTWAQFNSVQNYQVNNSDLGNVPFLANVTFSLPIPHTNIVPYIGGGGGGSDSIFYADNFFPQNAPGNFVQGSESDVVFAYQAFAGVRFLLNPNVSIGFGYRYFATGDPTFSYPPSPNLDVKFKGVQTHSVFFTFQANF